MRRERGKVDSEPAVLGVSSFRTQFGWCGIAGVQGVLHGVVCGQESPVEVMRALGRALPEAELEMEEWNPELRRSLERYARGEKVDFKKVKVALPQLTEFQQKVVEATRKIPHGATRSYGELATAAGYPRAARAVGSVMAANRFPIVIPCHRVVASQGKLGGYTSVRGVCLKEELLRVEGVDLATAKE